MGWLCIRGWRSGDTNRTATGPATRSREALDCEDFRQRGRRSSQLDRSNSLTRSISRSGQLVRRLSVGRKKPPSREIDGDSQQRGRNSTRFARSGSLTRSISRSGRLVRRLSVGRKPLSREVTGPYDPGTDGPRNRREGRGSVRKSTAKDSSETTSLTTARHEHLQERRRFGLFRRSSTDNKGTEGNSTTNSADTRRARALSATAKVPEGSLEIILRSESIAGHLSGATSAYRMIVPPLKADPRTFTTWSDVSHQCVKEEERQGKKIKERVKGMEWKRVLKMGMGKKDKEAEGEGEEGDYGSDDEEEEDEDEEQI